MNKKGFLEESGDQIGSPSSVSSNKFYYQLTLVFKSGQKKLFFLHS
jgi:hypothetical protein